VSAIEDERSEQPDWILESAESRRELEDLVKALPKTYRVVVYLHFFADLSYQEVADILNVKVGSVRTNVSRGLHMLRQILEKQKHEEESRR
jgi:RNA polymerase sigma-70 factor (ECF subfamily)